MELLEMREMLGVTLITRYPVVVEASLAQVPNSDEQVIEAELDSL